ncbi:MFS transporter [Limosilactobacillus difficilis]|uniref:MFS transporter n=1 Tax=Limosilactobacillus difficilis TaxID=2991838 RepID=UPI0024B8B572|nr:MFS transporter [Limosilactobacillus difficilis]
MSFSGVIVETSMNIAFPTLMREFGISTNVVQWITSIYLLAISVVVPISAALKSSFKTKSLFLAANLLFMIGLLTDALAPAFPVILLGRVIQGIGTGIALPLMFNIIMEQVPKSRVGMMMGVGNLITGIAPALGPTFGGIVVNTLGWRWIFYFLLPLLLISLCLGRWGIEQKSVIRKVSIDKLSFTAIAVFFAGMIFGFSNLSTGQWQIVASAIVIALISLLALIWRSNLITQPLLNLQLLLNHTFAAYALGFFLIQLISLGNAFLLSNHIQLVNGKTALVAGLTVLPAGFAGAIMGPIGGTMLDKYGARRPILAGVSLMAVEGLSFAIFARHLSVVMIAFVYILYMGGMGMTLGNVMTAALTHLQPGQVLQGNAILNTIQQFSGAVGTSLTSAIVAASQAQMGSKGPLPTAIGTQHAYLFLLILNVIIIGLFVKFAEGKKE